MSGEHSHPEHALLESQVAALAGMVEAQADVIAVVVERLELLEAATPAAEYPGQPTGDPLWGSATPNNIEPVGRYGQATQVHRLFYQWAQWDKPFLLDRLAASHVNGTLPWVSFKTPLWAAVASGSMDSGIDRILAALEHDNPVWLTMWHEPENDPDQGTAADWRAMQVRIRERIDVLGIANIAFAPVLMAWTWDARAGRDPADWWVDGIFDFLGVDHYTTPTGPQLLLTPVWDAVLASAQSWGVDVGVGEFGCLGDTGPLLESFYLGGGAMAYSYFDVDQVGVADWTLTGSRLAAFQTILES